jgi:predicted phage gp36 major capsid-like protein
MNNSALKKARKVKRGRGQPPFEPQHHHADLVFKKPVGMAG